MTDLILPREEKKLDIILATHNHLDLTIRAIDALYAYTNAPFRLIVVDDSTDLTATYLFKLGGEKDNLKLIHSDVPYTHHNQIIQTGLDHAESDIVGYLGNSTRVEPNWLDVALPLMKQDLSIGITGFKLVYESGSIEHAGIFWTPDMPHHYNIGVNEPGHRLTFIREVPAVGWALVLIRRAALIEPLDTKIYHGFRGYDDVDACFEMKKRGWKVIYCGIGAAYHSAGATRHENADEKFSQEAEENRQTFLERWGGTRKAIESALITRTYG